MKETRAPVILTRRARKLRQETGDERYRARAEEELPSLRTLLYISCTRPLRMSLCTSVFVHRLRSMQSCFSRSQSSPVSAAGLDSHGECSTASSSQSRQPSVLCIILARAKSAPRSSPSCKCIRYSSVAVSIDARPLGLAHSWVLHRTCIKSVFTASTSPSTVQKRAYIGPWVPVCSFLLACLSTPGLLSRAFTG